MEESVHYVSSDIPLEFVPGCEEQLKPFVGRIFVDFEAAIQFYRAYAEHCGFDIRRGTKQKKGVRQYVYCNREGDKNAIADDVGSATVKRRRVSMRVGCMARISILFDSKNGCVIERFVEAHTHQLVSPEYKKYMKVNRNLGFREKTFMMRCARANIGATKAYRLHKEMVGDYSSVGSVENDWKNHARDRKAYIDGCDAQLIIRKMALKKETCPAFYFDYAVDEKDRMTCLFWADPIAQRNFSVFGDVVSFDCTYDTNRYKLIFAPFTGKDNHGKIVTFAAALISGEDNKMYAWVFENFKECMRRAPKLIITDQDPAMKIAIERVFPSSNHRLCMWHIMMKVPERTPAHLRKNEEFKKRLNATVWSNRLVTADFEQQWNEIMSDFDLVDNNWFCGLYDIRHFWIPAYFRDLPMSGVCRTTSISESVNSFFGHYLSKGANLVEFIMHFESAMDAQRQNNDQLNSNDRNPGIILKTPLSFEKHAASVYTTNLFVKVQEQIEISCYQCSVISTTQQGACTIYEVDDGSQENLKVTFDKDDDTIVCSCNKFIRDGLLCGHIFLLFKQLKWSAIPEKYIVPRWTKKAYSCPLFGMDEVSLVGCAELDDNKKKINKLMSVFYACVGAVEGDNDKTQDLLDRVCNWRDVFVKGNVDMDSPSNNITLFENFYGMEKPNEIHVHPPLPVKTKGSGSDVKTRQEAAARRAVKPKRKCSKCGEYAYHDARNCKA